MFWELVWHLINTFVPIALIYYIYRTNKLEKRLDMAHERLFNETVNRMNGDE